MLHIYRKITPLLISALFIILSTSAAFGQFYFGKNKVQYTDFDWQVLETEHFRIYFYPEEDEIARIGARIAEDAYRELASKFNHEIYEKIPLIFYSSGNYFSQTNVIPSLLPESVGGFTEFLKGRVVVPYLGSFRAFEHVVRHELVHVFTISKLERTLSKHRLVRMAPPPLWFIEGLAEFWSTDWDSEADMMIKDMVLSGRIIPIEQLYQVSGSFLMYKIGQSICQFIHEHYGPHKLTLMFENWWRFHRFEDLVEYTLGDKLPEVSRKWEYSLKKKYYPDMADGGLVKREARQLTKSGYAVKGVPITLDSEQHSGDWIVYKANKRGYSGLYMMPRGGEKVDLHTILKGEQSAGYESLHLLQSGIDARNDGRVLFSSKSKESDVLYMYDIYTRRDLQKYYFPQLVAISSPRFSPDGNRAVFSASTKRGYTDIYEVNLLTGDLMQLTDDNYNDITPVYSLDGDSIIFSSDRCADGDIGAQNLFGMSRDDRRLIQLTHGNWIDISPEADCRGLYFASDRDGSFNIYRKNPDGSINKITNLLTGAFDPRVLQDNDEILFTGYQDMGFHLYSMEIIDTMTVAATETPVGKAFWKPGQIDGRSARSSFKYNTEYSFDIAQSAISYDPVYGTLGGLQVALSDMLGDNVFYFLLTNTAETKDDFLSSFNVGITYLNKKRRLNWGAGLFHFYDEYYNDEEGYFFERQVGGLLYVNYPISKFERFEASSYIRYSKKDIWLFDRKREALLVSNFISFVSDNSIWDISGPLEGHRYNLTLGLTAALDKGRMYSRTGVADVRHYFRLGRYSAFASRLFAYSSAGVEPQRIYFGGSWSFRGFDRRAFYDPNILFTSHELRFPLIDNLLVGFPIGGIGFQAIRGAIFFDAGSIWEDRFDEVLASTGAGFRVALGLYVVLRFDFARTTDFHSISPRTDFDFFFGWNF
jgi:WD40 repeat protein